MGKCLRQLALQSNPDQPLQWLLPQMVPRLFRVYWTFAIITFRAYWHRLA